MIEAWLLVTLAIVQAGAGSLHAEREVRHNQKRLFYSQPEATQDVVEAKALPMIRNLDPNQVANIRAHARSFDDFAGQVQQHRHRILSSLDCWQGGDRGGEV